MDGKIAQRIAIGESSQPGKNSAPCTNLLWLEREPVEEAPVRLFVRQPFTESGQGEKKIVQEVLNLLQDLDRQPHRLHVLTGLAAQSQETFRQSFEAETGLSFSPRNFRSWRLKLLYEAEAMLIVHTSLSESGAFEVAYNIFGGRKVPMLFAIWRSAPLKTTLLRDLDEFCCASYVSFDHTSELQAPLGEFLNTIVDYRWANLLKDAAASAGS